ncbi:MAG: hypothetical protein RL094_235 [Candidatus Parcubacteria bacterium]|jgi:glycosyltransferase involved in cell wall biosynthesis
MSNISVIIATKNGAAFISRAIKSVFEQSFANDTHTQHMLEVLIINDGSTDSTATVVNELKTFEPRLRLVNLPKNVGPGVARDIGIKEATGKYIAFIDDDDLWLSPQKLQKQHDFLDDHHEHLLVGSSTINIVKEDGSPIRTHKNPTRDEDIRAVLLQRNCFTTSSVMFRKEAYLKVGGFKPMYLNEDYDLWFRMGIEGKIANLDGCDVEYTIRKSSASSAKALEMNKITLDLIQTYKNNYPGYIPGLLRSYARILFLYVKNLF